MNKIFFMALALWVLALSACESFLDVKPAAKRGSPATMEDAALMLRNYALFNKEYPNVSEVASDNLYVGVEALNSVTARERKAYRWQATDDVSPFWSPPYAAIFSANIILEALAPLKGGDAERKDNLYAMALFWRAFYHYALADLFCKPYMEGSAHSDLGIPLKRSADINLIPPRSSVEETYAFIIGDIERAIPGLAVVKDNSYQPHRAAAYGLLARIYLAMGRYEKAGVYADSCLQIQPALMDYNSVHAAHKMPFYNRYEEIILDVQAAVSMLIDPARGRVDSLLVEAYNQEDLRLQAFFVDRQDGSRGFKGHYLGSSYARQFVGLATDEMYLIRAESYARAGAIKLALDDLNFLLKHRWKKDAYVAMVALEPEALLSTILLERRKELLFRCLRRSDLRRLNQESRFQQTLYRNLDGELISLEPHADRYVFRIDRRSVVYSGIVQNP